MSQQSRAFAIVALPLAIVAHAIIDQAQAQQKAQQKAQQNRPAQAPLHQHQAHPPRLRAGHRMVVCDQRGCSDQAKRKTYRAGRHVALQAADPVAADPGTADANGNRIVGSRPGGCPHAFCGCEASRYVFGAIRPELNLASNWIVKFPRTSPAPGMVAARPHHVMVLMHHVEGNRWFTHDGNSGGGMTREHIVSIKGYVIVDPHVARTAAEPSSGRTAQTN